MISLQEWINRSCKLESRLYIGEEIDDEMASRLTGYFPSADPDMIQILRRQAEPAYDANGSRKNTYNTFQRVDGKWRYVGRCFMDETENRHHIYLLFYCNEWKEWFSMRVAATATNPLVFRGILKSFVKSGDMEYGTDASNLDTLDFEQINSCLQYGHIMVVDDGAITN